jgi:hypothetical protein
MKQKEPENRADWNVALLLNKPSSALEQIVVPSSSG